MTKVLFIALVLVCTPLLGQAAPGTTVLIHCPNPCKVYKDGTLVASLSGDGLKQLIVQTGVRTTILISRQGKPDWVRSITPAQDISINPDQPNPTPIPSDSADSAGTTSQSSSGPAENTSSASNSHNTEPELATLPTWATEGYKLRDPIEDKKMMVKEGNHQCPVTINLDLTLFLDDRNSSRFEYDQDMDGEYLDPAHNDWCVDHDDDPVFKQEWKFSVLITLTKVSDDEVSLKADKANWDCRGPLAEGECKLPPGLDGITGTITRTGADELTLHLAAPFNQSFVMVPIK